MTLRYDTGKRSEGQGVSWLFEHLIPSKREAGVQRPADNEQMGTWQEKRIPPYPWEWGFAVSKGAQQPLTWQEPSIGWGSRQCLGEDVLFLRWSPGMQKKRLSLWKQQQHGARNTCQLILANKRDLRMGKVLYLVSTSTSHTSVQSLWGSALGVTVWECWSCSQRCSVYGQNIHWSVY